MSKLIKTEKFTKNKIHYLKEYYDSGTIVIYCDPKFQEPGPGHVKPSLPDLSTTNKKLDFIISELNLKIKYQQ